MLIYIVININNFRGSTKVRLKSGPGRPRKKSKLEELEEQIGTSTTESTEEENEGNRKVRKKVTQSKKTASVNKHRDATAPKPKKAKNKPDCGGRKGKGKIKKDTKKSGKKATKVGNDDDDSNRNKAEMPSQTISGSNSEGSGEKDDKEEDDVTKTGDSENKLSTPIPDDSEGKLSTPIPDSFDDSRLSTGKSEMKTSATEGSREKYEKEDVTKTDDSESMLSTPIPDDSESKLSTPIADDSESKLCTSIRDDSESKLSTMIPDSFDDSRTSTGKSETKTSATEGSGEKDEEEDSFNKTNDSQIKLSTQIPNSSDDSRIITGKSETKSSATGGSGHKDKAEDNVSKTDDLESNVSKTFGDSSFLGASEMKTSATDLEIQSTPMRDGSLEEKAHSAMNDNCTALSETKTSGTDLGSQSTSFCDGSLEEKAHSAAINDNCTIFSEMKSSATDLKVESTSIRDGSLDEKAHSTMNDDCTGLREMKTSDTLGSDINLGIDLDAPTKEEEIFCSTQSDAVIEIHIKPASGKSEEEKINGTQNSNDLLNKEKNENAHDGQTEASQSIEKSDGVMFITESDSANDMKINVASSDEEKGNFSMKISEIIESLSTNDPIEKILDDAKNDTDSKTQVCDITETIMSKMKNFEESNTADTMEMYRLRQPEYSSVSATTASSSEQEKPTASSSDDEKQVIIYRKKKHGKTKRNKKKEM